MEVDLGSLAEFLFSHFNQVVESIVLQAVYKHIRGSLLLYDIRLTASLIQVVLDVDHEKVFVSVLFMAPSHSMATISNPPLDAQLQPILQSFLMPCHTLLFVCELWTLFPKILFKLVMINHALGHAFTR